MKRSDPKPPPDWPTDRIFLENEAEDLDLSEDPFSEAPIPHAQSQTGKHSPAPNEDTEITLVNRKIADLDVTVKNIPLEPAPEKPDAVPLPEIPNPSPATRPPSIASNRNAILFAVLLALFCFGAWAARYFLRI